MVNLACQTLISIWKHLQNQHFLNNIVSLNQFKSGIKIMRIIILIASQIKIPHEQKSIGDNLKSA